MDTPVNLAIYIIGALGVFFLGLGAYKRSRDETSIAAKTYVRTGVIFILITLLNIFLLS